MDLDLCLRKIRQLYGNHVEYGLEGPRESRLKS